MERMRFLGNFFVKEIPQDPMTIQIDKNLPDEIPILIPVVYNGEGYFISAYEGINGVPLVRDVGKWNKELGEFYK